MNDEYNIEKYFPLPKAAEGDVGISGSCGPNDDGYLNGKIRKAADFLCHACGFYHHGRLPQLTPTPFPDDHPLTIVLNILKEIDKRTAWQANEKPDPALFDKHRHMIFQGTVKIQT